MRPALLLPILFLVLRSHAQAPALMSYQAVIRDASNALVANATVGIRISVLQSTANGTAVFVETHAATTNTNGLATVQVGAGAVVSGSMAGIDWSARATRACRTTGACGMRYDQDRGRALGRP